MFQNSFPFAYLNSQSGGVIGKVESANYKELERLSCEAFNILRDNANNFIVLLKLMLRAGIEELSSPDDIRFLKKRLVLNLSHEEAADHFKQLMRQAVRNIRQLVSDTFHTIRHHRNKSLPAD